MSIRSSKFKESPYIKSISEAHHNNTPEVRARNDSVQALKTIAQKHGIKKSRAIIENLMMKEVMNIAQQCALGNTQIGELSNFDKYFCTNNYDAFKINESVKDNLLFFTLMFNFY